LINVNMKLQISVVLFGAVGSIHNSHNGLSYKTIISPII